MPDELKLKFSLDFNKGGASVKRISRISLDVTGDAFSHEIKSVDITEVQLIQGPALGTPGYVFLINLDINNFVEVGASTGVYTVKLKAGEVALYRHDGETIYAKANIAPCLIEYIIIED